MCCRGTASKAMTRCGCRGTGRRRLRADGRGAGTEVGAGARRVAQGLARSRSEARWRSRVQRRQQARSAGGAQATFALQRGRVIRARTQAAEPLQEFTPQVDRTLATQAGPDEHASSAASDSAGAPRASNFSRGRSSWAVSDRHGSSLREVRAFDIGRKMAFGKLSARFGSGISGDGGLPQPAHPARRQRWHRGIQGGGAGAAVARARRRGARGDDGRCNRFVTPGPSGAVRRSGTHVVVG